MLFRWRRPAGEDAELWCPVAEGVGWIGRRDDEEGNDEESRHRVEIQQPFWLSAVPVTNALYAAFDDTKKFERWPDVATGDLETHPRVNVTWYEAVAFCRWLATQSGFAGTSPNLPEEEVWEYSCRAGSETRFWAGEEDECLAEVGWYTANSGGRTHRVGGKPANGLGLFDMHGNVREWTASSFGPERYLSQSQDKPRLVDPAASSTDLAASFLRGKRVMRGGSYGGLARICRSAYRNTEDPGTGLWSQGFRVLLSSAPSRP